MFDRIPHRQSRSPKAQQQTTIEVEEENVEAEEEEEKIVTLGPNNLEQIQEETQAINSINLQNPFIFKTFEDQQKIFNESKKAAQSHQ